MMKPRLVKSLIAQNAALIREKQQLLEYFKVVEIVLRSITMNGKDTGVVDLKELNAICKEMRMILSGYEISNYEKTGSLRSPTKKDLGNFTKENKESIQGFFYGTPEDMKDFFDKMISDFTKMKRPDSEQPYENYKDSFEPFGSEMKFGNDLDEGGLESDESGDVDEGGLFGQNDVDKPE